MNPLFISTAAGKFITAFSWTLIHSLWQGLLLAIIAGAVLMLNKKWGAVYRYNLALVLFIALIGMCVTTFMFEWNHAASRSIVRPIAGAIRANVSQLFSGNVSTLKQLGATFTGYFTQNAPLVVMVWFMFFLFKSVKMIGCVVYNQRIRTRQVYAPDKFWADAVAGLSKKLQINKVVGLFQSGYVKVPVVIGHLKPIILIPVGLMASLPADQVEAILLHELAHIRRNDYFVNFLQNIAETVFFFNPGLLWLSSLLREERENCCDDVALAQTNNKTGFVQALISFKEYELYGSKYATAFPGKKKNHLLRRVSRILSNTNQTFGLGEKVFFVASLIMLSAVVATATVSQLKEYHKRTIHPKAIVKPVTGNAVLATTVALHGKIAQGKHTSKMPVSMANINIAGASIADAATVVANNGVPYQQPDIRVEATPRNAEQIQAEKDRQQAEKDRQQADKDREQAVRDREQAEKDRAQADNDRSQAMRDQAQAQKNQQQALVDQSHAKAQQSEIRSNNNQVTENKNQVERNNEQVRLNKIQSQKNQEQADRNKEQARLNEIQSQKNREQERLNEIQARKNQDQERLNEIQAKKNQQASKNRTSVQE